jgi:hypothetical protein
MDGSPIIYYSFCDYFLNNRFYKKQKHQLLIKKANGELKKLDMIKQ